MDECALPSYWVDEVRKALRIVHELGRQGHLSVKRRGIALRMIEDEAAKVRKQLAEQYCALRSEKGARLPQKP